MDSDAAKATSAEDLGGMNELVKAAEKEGELNVIALPPDWANYANVIKGFEKKYDIKINSAQPDAASQEEINAAKKLKGTQRAPDVFDLGRIRLVQGSRRHRARRPAEVEPGPCLEGTRHR